MISVDALRSAPLTATLASCRAKLLTPPRKTENIIQILSFKPDIRVKAPSLLKFSSDGAVVVRLCEEAPCFLAM